MSDPLMCRLLGALFAHNGVRRGFDRLDARLAELGVADLVLGETDSERVFALVTAEIAAHNDDVGAGSPPDRLDRRAPARLLRNFVLTTATDLWALRYPVANELWLLPRRVDGSAGRGALDARTDAIHVGSAALADRPSVVVASEPMDGDWVGARCPAVS